jgi:hypothetical protein
MIAQDASILKEKLGSRVLRPQCESLDEKRGRNLLKLTKGSRQLHANQVLFGVAGLSSPDHASANLLPTLKLERHGAILMH